MGPLLDANVLIALIDDGHEHHDRASVWLAIQPAFALCAIVEGALVRYVIRLGETATTAQELLTGVRALPTCEFWADAPSYADVDLSTVHGHRQVTDAYLVGLAQRRSSSVATFDAGFARQFPKLTMLIA